MFEKSIEFLNSLSDFGPVIEKQPPIDDTFMESAGA